MRAQEGVDLHDLGAEGPKLARNPALTTAHTFLVGFVRVAEFFPQPAARTGKDARAMRTKFFAGEQVARALAVIGHADRNIDTCPVEWNRQRIGNGGGKTDPPVLAVEVNSN